MIPGEIIAAKDAVTINDGLPVKTLTVRNKGDRPIQVGSHFHFFEANKFLDFNRAGAYGYRLDIPSGTAVRFEPNEQKSVSLVEIAGNRRIRGLNNLTDAQINNTTINTSIEKAVQKGFIGEGV
ncbi:MAG: urease subunit beta [Ruminococcus sp.]|jgi:urease beta subunit|nr:urease subunit beta [Ruminococcus sp.]